MSVPAYVLYREIRKKYIQHSSSKSTLSGALYGSHLYQEVLYIFVVRDILFNSASGCCSTCCTEHVIFHISVVMIGIFPYKTIQKIGIFPYRIIQNI